MNLTVEQKAVVESNAESLLVNAYAGCGKTSTLAAYASARPDQRFLYLAFNRAIKQEAERRFPSNVRCVTTHGMAFPSFGRLYQSKLGQPKPYQLVKAFNISLPVAGGALKAVNSFLSSGDLSIHAHFKASNFTSDEADCAVKAWELMQLQDDSRIPMPHDGYLKLFQLSQPTIKTDCILFDEAQDANPVTIALIDNQSCKRVIVGDRYQAIYSFRGAVNAMETMKSRQALRLTESFRFGGGIAHLASSLLNEFRGERVPLRGLGKHETVWQIEEGDAYAALSRTNAGLFDGAVSVLNKKKFAFSGGVDNYRFDSILDAYHVYAGKRSLVKDRLIASFGGWDELSFYANELDDKELKSLVRIVENHRHSVPVLIERIKKGALADESKADVIFSTVHKAKGLEWDSVRLLDDFTPLEGRRDKETGRFIPPENEEINLTYVAITRAARVLECNSAINNWISKLSVHGQDKKVEDFSFPAY